MGNDNLWAIMPEMADETLRLLAEREEGEKAAFKARFGRDALSGADEVAAEIPLYALKDGVAVIKISGPIERDARVSFWTGLPYTAGQDIIREGIEAALADPEVSAILLSIDSPGGVVSGTKELADYIASIRDKKPIAAYADGLCASAAFWLAAATGQVFAPKTAQLGSIGVIAVLTDWTRAADKAGITRTVIHSGKWKAAGSPDKPLTDEERDLFQKRLTDIHTIFTADVVAHLSLAASSTAWAEGQTFLAEEALTLGLLTQIVQDRDEAVAILKAQISKGDIFMNLEELKAKYPDLAKELATEITAQIAAEQSAALAVKIEEASANAQKDTLALVAAIGGAEIAQKAETLIAAKISASQLEALKPLLANSAAPQPDKADDPEAKFRAEILAAINAASGEPLPASKTTKPASALMADAERRAQAARSN